MFHLTRDAIEAHLTIVFTALAVAHCIQERRGLSIAKVVKQLRPLRSATIIINGATQTFPPEIAEPHRQLLHDLGIEVSNRSSTQDSVGLRSVGIDPERFPRIDRCSVAVWNFHVLATWGSRHFPGRRCASLIEAHGRVDDLFARYGLVLRHAGRLS